MFEQDVAMTTKHGWLSTFVAGPEATVPSAAAGPFEMSGRAVLELSCVALPPTH